jgi:hypothetical protein
MGVICMVVVRWFQQEVKVKMGRGAKMEGERERERFQ